MSTHVLPGTPPVPLLLRRSARARRITLRISQLDGRVTLTLPMRTPETEALRFAEAKAEWIRRHLDGVAAPDRPAAGSVIPIEGTPRRIETATGRQITTGPDTIAVPGDGAALRARLRGYLRTLARDRLTAASDRYAAELGRPFSRITLRDTRSRWGSCSSAGALMYSWRLILAPPAVLRYVAAHEVAHLAEMNHSAAFWNTVTAIHGPYDAPRTWLRREGSALHRWRFDD